jgi:hypothetical protein
MESLGIPLVYFGGQVVMMRLCVNFTQYSISNVMEVMEVILCTLHELMKDRPCHMKRTLDDDFQGSFCFTPQKLYNAQHHLP